MLTRCRNTVVNVDFTETSSHAGYAGAGKIVNHIDTSRTLETGIAGALVNVNFAVEAHVTGGTYTFVGIYL